MLDYSNLSPKEKMSIIVELWLLKKKKNKNIIKY